MANSTKNLCSLLGRCRSGREILIPYDLNDQNVNRFIDEFEVNDQVDVYCVVEYELLRLIKHENPGMDLSAIVVVHDYLQLIALEAALSHALESMNLVTSIDRVRLGMRLSL